MIKPITEDLLKNLESVRERTKKDLEISKTDEWIPVTERLPKKGKWVLLTYMWDDELIPLTGYGYRIDDEHFFTISGEENESELLNDFTVTASH